MKPLVAFALCMSALVVAFAATDPSDAFASSRHTQSMKWVRWQPSAVSRDAHALGIGSRAVVGVGSMRDLGQLRARYDFELIHVLPSLHAAEIRTTRALLDNARRDPRLRYLTPSGASNRLLTTPNAPYLTEVDPRTGVQYEWQFAAANVGAALALSSGSASVVVGAIDSGTADVPDLDGKVDSRWRVSPTGNVSSETQARDYLGHGTAVASLIAGNGFSMAGFGGATDVVSVRARVLSDVAIAAALMKLDSLGVRIVNMSFGQDTPESPIVLDAIHKAEVDGMLLIAAAGNSSAPVAHPAADLQPANGVESAGLAVGASDVTGALAFFSNSGDNLSLLAPGTYLGRCSGVLVAAPISPYFVNACYTSWYEADGGSYAYVSGTSFAAPEVAGIAALIWAARPTLTNYQVADIIKQSARRSAGWTTAGGCGTLDAGGAVTLALSRSGEEWAETSPPGSPCAAVG